MSRTRRDTVAPPSVSQRSGAILLCDVCDLRLPCLTTVVHPTIARLCWFRYAPCTS